MVTMNKIMIWADNSAFRSRFFYCWLRQTQPPIKKSSAQVGLQIFAKIKSQIKIKVHALFANF